MIRARLTNGDLLFGLDAENIRRLIAGDSALIDCHQLGIPVRIMLVYGATMEAIMADLERKNGGPLPPAQPYFPGPGEAS